MRDDFADLGCYEFLNYGGVFWARLVRLSFFNLMFTQVQLKCKYLHVYRIWNFIIVYKIYYFSKGHAEKGLFKKCIMLGLLNKIRLQLNFNDHWMLTANGYRETSISTWRHWSMNVKFTFDLDDVGLVTRCVCGWHDGKRGHMTDGAYGGDALPRRAEHAAHGVHAGHNHDVHVKPAALL